MATTLTVFYAWQSDTPLDYNKDFIWKALNAAAERISASTTLGGTRVLIDADTKGVPGTPPVTETLLAKIEAADVFACDLTFVAKTSGGKLVPNPNVMAEWGYALKRFGFGAMMPVMNVHYGPPEALPFDMGHIRHPLKYSIEPAVAKDAERREKRAKLSETFEEILTGYVRARLAQARTDTPFQPHEGVRAPAFYFHPGHPLVSFETSDPPLAFKSEKAVYMRLYPAFGEQPRIGNTGAQSVVERLKPMSGMVIPVTAANEFGAITVDTDSVRIDALTQVFASGELWGISAKPFRSGQPELVVAVNVEQALSQTVDNWLKVVRDHLRLVPPFLLEVGVVGLKGSVLAYPGVRGSAGGVYSRPYTIDEIYRDYRLESFNLAEWQQALREFFFDLYDVVGLRREDLYQPANIEANGLLPLTPV